MLKIDRIDQRVCFGPYGEPGTLAGPVFRYTGQRLDPTIGIYFYKARFYSAALGRFLQTDPMGMGDDPNLYQYAYNGPVTFSDPSGLDGGGAGTSSDPFHLGYFDFDRNGNDPFSHESKFGSIISNVSNMLTDFGRGFRSGFSEAHSLDCSGCGGNLSTLSGYFVGGAVAGTAVSLVEGLAADVGFRGVSRVLSSFAAKSLSIGEKVAKQLGPRGWTRAAIDEAKASGQQVRAINKANGNAATRYVHPQTGQSVTIEDATGEVIHVGGPGFKCGPGSGDLP